MPSPRRAEIDATLTIAPAPRSAITGTAYLDARNAVRRLMSKARSQASSVVSTTVPSDASPMLFTRMSTVPKASTAALTIASHSAARVTSAPNTLALPPSSSIICRVCSARSGCRSTSRTLAPSRASTTAVALPVPIPGPGIEPAPVTIATLPSTRPTRSTMTAPLSSSKPLTSASEAPRPPRSRRRWSPRRPPRPLPADRRPRPGAGAPPRRCGRTQRAGARRTAVRPRC